MEEYSGKTEGLSSGVYALKGTITKEEGQDWNDLIDEGEKRKDETENIGQVLKYKVLGGKKVSNLQPLEPQSSALPIEL